MKDVEGAQIWMNKDQIEDADMIKIDVLSNRGLSQLWDISKRELTSYNINDTKIINLLLNGDNIGITHAESRAMMKVFKTMKPKSLKEIAIALALIRPAASKNYQKSYFLKDYTPYKYNSDNYLIFDDDATLFIKKLINCSSAEADNFRRAFSKNKEKEKEKFIDILSKIWNTNESKLINTLKSKNETIDDLIVRLEQLEFYSFCKSHAFSYAQLVVGLAYQKCHYPKDFWLSTLNICNSSYRKWVHFREASYSGIKLRLGKKPFVLINDELIPKKIVTQKEIRKFNLDKSIHQLLNYGYWTSKEFLPNMYYHEYWNPLTKRHKNTEKLIFNENKDKIKYAKFKGIIATHRCCKKEGNETKKSFITFVTIASNDKVYHDLVLYGYQKMNKTICISGYGKIRFDGFCKWIDVIKWNTEYIS